jgi:L-threonylcarbamoyladenylate synthase
MITTNILSTDPEHLQQSIDDAAEVLRRGGLVAFPTETVYGLGADAFNAAAVERVFQAKNRPPDNPLIVHVAGIGQLHDIARSVPANALRLAERFWPGPLTLVVEHRRQLPPQVTAGLPTVAVRVPRHRVALLLIERLGRGIVGPSANASGRPSPTTAQHVAADLGGKIELILDAGPTAIGVESTVVDATTDPPAILRRGGLSRSEIESVVGPVRTASVLDQLKRSPGTRHRHYAPSAKVELVAAGDGKNFAARLERLLAGNKTVGCIVHSITPRGAAVVHSIRQEEYAQRLFDLLRGFDEIGVDVILVESVPETGIGEAVMDRLRKASESH